MALTASWVLLSSVTFDTTDSIPQEWRRGSIPRPPTREFRPSSFRRAHRRRRRRHRLLEETRLAKRRVERVLLTIITWRSVPSRISSGVQHVADSHDTTLFNRRNQRRPTDEFLGGGWKVVAIAGFFSACTTTLGGWGGGDSLLLVFGRSI